MKLFTFAALLLSLLLAINAFAQQTSSSQSTSQVTPASQSAPNLEPIPPQTKTDFWDGDDPNLVNLVTHPFANKKYVQRMTRPIADRLNELEELTSENSRSIKNVDSSAQQGIQLASEKVNLADQHSTDAGIKADAAKLAANQASSRVSTVEQQVSSLDQFKGTAQTEIRFRPGQTVLSKQAKDALDQMAAPLKDQHSYMIEVQGFASGQGQAAIATSQKIADSVVRYLVLTHQIPVYRIHVLSMGNAPIAGDGTAKRIVGGRVEVNLLKNDLLTAAQH